MGDHRGDFLASLTAGLATELVKAGGSWLQRKLRGDEQQQAFQRCVQAGLLALLAAAQSESADERVLLADIVERFLSDPDVVGELTPLLHGNPLDMDELVSLFGEMGYDAETLPGLDLRAGLRAFELGFLAAAREEPALAEIIRTGQLDILIQQGDRQVDLLRQMARALQGARPGSVGVSANTITAENVAGVQIIFQWAPRNAADDPCDREAAGALDSYRRMVARDTAHLPLRGVDVGASDPTAGQGAMRLASVYVQLDTKAPGQPEEEGESVGPEASALRRGTDGSERPPLSALQATVAHRHMVLLGDPGSGKSTFANHLAHCLAQHALHPDGGWLARLPGWPDDAAGLVPVPVVLRDWARSLPDRLPRKAEARHLADFIEGRLAAQKLGDAADPLWRALERGEALVLLDGLDEVSNTAQRLFVRDAVRAFMGRYPDSRYLLTCRVLSYQPPSKDKPDDLRLPELPAYELAPLDERKIEALIDAWYAELAALGVIGAATQEELRAGLWRAVHRPDLWRLARNPLLLTVMALVNTHKGRLPDARALLYEETVEILLWRWEQVNKAADQGEGPQLVSLLAEAGRTNMDLKRVLYALAYDAHMLTPDDGDGEALADIGEWALEKALAALKGDDRNWACRLIEVIKTRAGLLIERDTSVFTFPHRTFQEYLAGAHLANQGDFARQACGLAERGATWRPAILLAVGRLVHTKEEVDKPLALAGELCPVTAPDDDTAWRKAWLAGEVLLEIGTTRVQDGALGRDLLVRTRGRLVDLIEGGELSPRERAEAGAVLARLGDPRVEVTTLAAMRFCYVPAGPFVMGSPESDGDASGYEKPLHSQEVPYDYWIARYPVTVAQYREYVEASGHTPGDPDRLADEDNHPVAYVSWHEARQFCAWLTAEWRGQGLLPAGGVVRLPTEPEWEKAARGGLEIPESPILCRANGAWVVTPYAMGANLNPRRRYPWGDAPDPNRANYEDARIGDASAVGCFAGRASVYGAEELSGNVWEWTQSLWGPDSMEPEYGYPYDPADGREEPKREGDVLRVVRGGSWGNDARRARCAYRGRYYPFARHDPLGIRVVVALPISPGR